jgi:DNA-binding MarR family transcriptional regulator
METTPVVASNVAPTVAREPDQPDRLDARLDVWKREIPNLDIPTEGIVQRIGALARYLDRSMEETLTQYGLDRREYSIISHLRYGGPPYRRSPGDLCEELRLSSGAMTNRLDRLEAVGLIRRLRDPDDRRGTLIEPTEAGNAAWDRSAGAQARREALIASALSEAEKDQLHGLLRRLMHAFPREYATMKKTHPEADE